MVHGTNFIHLRALKFIYAKLVIWVIFMRNTEYTSLHLTLKGSNFKHWHKIRPKKMRIFVYMLLIAFINNS